MIDIERALKTIDRWSRHLDKLEPETVGDAVDIDMHQDDLEHLRGVVQAARHAPASGEVEPDWSDSKTLGSEGWKNPLLSKNDRLQIADGAVAWRDEVIKNLRSRGPQPAQQGDVPEFDYDHPTYCEIIERIAEATHRLLIAAGHDAETALDMDEALEANIYKNIDMVALELEGAQQGSVPEFLIDAAYHHFCKLKADYPEFSTVRHTERSRFQAAVNQLLVTLASPQPEGDGWVKCRDQLPKLGQRVELFSQGVVQHMMPLFDEDDDGLFWDFEVHDYNPPVDISRDQWRPMPQPPQEQ